MKMTEERIEGRLRLHIANIALSAVGKRDGALKDAKDALIREVVRIVHDATNPHLSLATSSLRIPTDRTLPTSIISTVSAGDYVEGPASEVDANASYTFEAEIDGRWRRWTGQKPTIAGDRCRFWLRDGTPIAAPPDGERA